MLQCLVEENLDRRLGGEVTVDARIIVHFVGVGGGVGAEVVGKEVKSRGGELVRTTLHRTLHQVLHDWCCGGLR